MERIWRLAWSNNSRFWRGFRRHSAPAALSRRAYSGANLFAFDGPSCQAVALWRSVEQDRKKGYWMLQRWAGLYVLEPSCACGR
jgi:hypothetical protein